MRERRVLPVNTKITKVQPNILQSMRIPHIIGNCLGLLPVCGITSDSPQGLNFSWIALNTVYTFCYLLVGIYILIVCIRWILLGSQRIMFFCNSGY